jgi:ribosomal protein S20
MMSKKQSKITMSASSRKIRRAVVNLQHMPREKRIDLMVEAGVMTSDQAARAKRNLAELPMAE